MFKIGDRVRLLGENEREYQAGEAIVISVDPMFLKWEGKGYGNPILPYPEEYFELVLFLADPVFSLEEITACTE